MSPQRHALEIPEIHRLAELVQYLNVGLVMLDRSYRICFWNSFMENHSGLSSYKTQGRDLFELFPEIPADWFRRKTESVFLLNSQTFTVWEQRPCLFTFRNVRPLTGVAEFMYQNIVIIPLAGLDGDVNHVALIVYDVTDVAIGKQALTLANVELEKRSRTDRLTGLHNRGYWEERVVQEFRRYQRTSHPVSLVMFDIDHFKNVNDNHGHQGGDEVIHHIALLLNQNLRDTDIPGRYGGEEFAVVLVNCNANSARYFAERLRKVVASSSVQHGSVDIRCTISLGVAELDADTGDHKHWISRADQALYRSKQGGRNRVTVFSGGNADPVSDQT